MSCTLITGASNGIGREFVREFARRKSDLVLVARSESLLRQLIAEVSPAGSPEIHICAEDLGDPQSPQRVYEYCARNALRVELIVNCAGFGFAGGYASMPLDELQEMVQVNTAAMAVLVRLFIPDMIAQKKGGVINISSIGGFQGVPFLGLYAATKSFIITFSESLHEELSDQGIKVVVVCPGYVETGFHARANQYPEHSILPVSKPSVVVKAAIKGLYRNRLHVFPTFLDFLLVFLQRFLPRRVVLKTAAFLAPFKYKGESSTSENALF
ncbi:MAG: SDR family oxidoreductase [Chlorobiales bacterium]|nr:SDR family oxidoreductase [Chlorobiales bacterium]